MVFLLFENLERVSVSPLMLSAKQGNHWYHVTLRHGLLYYVYMSVYSNNEIYISIRTNTPCTRTPCG